MAQTQDTKRREGTLYIKGARIFAKSELEQKKTVVTKLPLHCPNPKRAAKPDLVKRRLPTARRLYFGEPTVPLHVHISFYSVLVKVAHATLVAFYC